MALEFVTDMPKKATAIDPMDRARAKFIAGVADQIALSKNPDYTIEKIKYVDGTKTTINKAPRQWWQMVADKVYVPIKYGNRQLDLDGGGIAVTDKKGLTDTLTTISDMGKNGDFDAAIAKAAVRVIRK